MNYFSLSVKGEDFKELKHNLIIAANSIKDEESEPQLTGYTQAPQPDQDDVDDEPEVFLPPLTPVAPPVAVVQHSAPIPNFAAPAPVAQEVTSPITANTVDVHGIRWDKRIHASSQNFNKDGSWRYRRGIDDAYIKQIESELYAARSHVPNAPQMHTAPSPVQPAPVGVPSYISPVFEVGKALPPEAVAILAQPAAPVSAPSQVAQPDYDNIPVASGVKRKQAHDLKSFTATLMPSLAKLMNEKMIDQTYVDSLAKHFGVNQIWEISNNPAQIAELFESFCQHGLITRVGP